MNKVLTKLKQFSFSDIVKISKYGGKEFVKSSEFTKDI